MKKKNDLYCGSWITLACQRLHCWPTPGITCLGVDINEHAVETINKGGIHIVEPDLDAFVRAAVVSKRLQAFTTPQPADIYMICVPTPFHEGGGYSTAQSGLCAGRNAQCGIAGESQATW
jgi:UDP-N-acetyl-D-mannosaminuronate dehydrogenase